MLRDLASVERYADTAPASRDWYAEVLGIESRFAHRADDDPAHARFRIGDPDPDPGLVDRRFTPPDHPTHDTPITHWDTDDADRAIRQVVSRGADVHRDHLRRAPDLAAPLHGVLDPLYEQHRRRVEGDWA